MSVTNVKNPCLRVPLDKGEDTRRLLLEKGLLRTDLQIKHDERFLYLPLKDKTSKVEVTKLCTRILKKTDRDKGLYYKDLVNVPADLRVNLPSSYDIIGDIILIKIPSILEPYKRSIGEALMEANRNIRVVYSIKPVQGELRLRDVEVIAGEDKTETTHREYGLALDSMLKKRITHLG
jgi:tRNA (guanine37-N1)-methyltransferase